VGLAAQHAVGLALFGQPVDQEGPVLEARGALQREVPQLPPGHEDELAEAVRHAAVLRHVQRHLLQGVVRLVGDGVRVAGEGVVGRVPDQLRHLHRHLRHLQLLAVLHAVDDAPGHCTDKQKQIKKCPGRA
jgi:hypothetical protein